MKELKKILLAMSVIMMLCASAGCTSKEKDIVGGWSAVEDGTITDELQELFDKATAELDGVDYKPVKLLETQVVAGTNHCVLVKNGAGCVLVTLYRDLGKR